MVVVLVAVVGAGLVGRRVVHKLRHHHVEFPAARTGPTWDPPAVEVPAEHPRLWWTPARLARARARVKGHPFRPRDDDPTQLALAYLLEGDRPAGEKAVAWLRSLELNTSGVASDAARWNGEDAMLVFDWCHDLLTAADRQKLIERWNGYVDTLNRKRWGNVGMEENNYYWGYLRNGIEWGIASAHENPQAAKLLDYALRARFGQSFVPFASGPGRGGVLGEGSQYGPYLVDYATVPFASAEAVGANLWDASNFFREAVYYLVYATTPTPTITTPGAPARFELFPFDDDEHFLEQGGSAQSPELAMFMTAAAEHWSRDAVGRHARAWLDLVSPALPLMAEGWPSPTPVPRLPLTGLPVDYYAPGAGYLYARNKWGPDASVVDLQLGMPQGVGHQHVDWGTFQIWRKGRWLTRESVGYAVALAGWGGGGGGKPAPVGCDGALGHNTVLFEGMGARSSENRRAHPRVLRVESRPAYAYAAVDLSESYRCSLEECRPERDDNPYAGSLIREFVYLRPLEALVVFDRAESAGDRKPADQVVKTFVLHTENAPALVPGGLVAQSGDQVLRLTTLLPARAAPRVVVEGPPVGQFRTEIDERGPALGYFLNVLQARGAADPDLRVQLTETDGAFTVTLSHPSRGSAVVVFQKGKSSQGGKVGYAPAGRPTPSALAGGIQRIEVTASGPRWQ